MFNDVSDIALCLFDNQLKCVIIGLGVQNMLIKSSSTPSLSGDVLCISVHKYPKKFIHISPVRYLHAYIKLLLD